MIKQNMINQNNTIISSDSSADATYAIGKALHLKKDLISAKTQYLKALTINPEHFETNYMLAMLSIEEGRLTDATPFLLKTIELNPRHAHSFNTLGYIFFANKQFDHAIQCYDQALDISPHFSEALNNRGNAYNSLNQYSIAMQDFIRAIALTPDHFEPYLNLGICFAQTGDYPQAISKFQIALTISPKNALVCFHLGYAFDQIKQHQQSVYYYQLAIKHQPHYPEAYLNLGDVLKDMHDHPNALHAYDQAIQQHPQHAPAWSKRGILLYETHQHQEAIDHCNKAIALDPNNVDAYCNRGVINQHLLQFDQAFKDFNHGISINSNHPECLWNNGLAHLQLGQYDLGWPGYEARWHVKSLSLRQELRIFDSPQWDGNQSLTGKTIFIYAEQGLGDTIQFSRFIPLLQQLSCQIILEVQAPLVTLIKNSFKAITVIAKGTVRPTFDYHCALMSLPLMLKITLHNIPSTTPYIQSDSANRVHWQQHLAITNTPKIGLVWQGNPTHRNDHHRSLSLTALVAHLPQGFEYISLQKELRPNDAQTLAKHPYIRHFGEQINDFADTAALCALMDIVISVDTSVAHLAGALGKPLWVLLPHAPDWRWLLDRTDSPWYPTARLFRATQDGHWQDALTAVQLALQLAIQSGFPQSANHD